MDRVEPSFFRKSVSLFLSISYFCLNAAVTAQIGSFFPKEAERKGLSKISTGVITGLNDAVALFLGFFIHRFVGIANLKTIYWVSYFIFSLSVAAFGMLTFAETTWVYITVAVIIRAVAGAVSCAVCAIVVPMTFQLFPEYRGQVSGALQFLFEAGSLLGPLLGAAFFNIQGFYLPFVMSGGVALILSILSAVFVLPYEENKPLPEEYAPLKPASEDRRESVQSESEHKRSRPSSPTFQPLTMQKILTIPDIYLASTPHFTVSMTTGLFSVFLAPWLVDLHGVKERQVAYYFIPAPAVAIVLSPLIGYLVNSSLKWPVYIFTPAIGAVGCGLFVLDTFWDIRSSINLFLLLMSLACFGFCYSAGWVSGNVILDDVFHSYAKDDVNREYRVLLSNWSNNICFLGGRWIGNTILGGVMFDFIDFEGVVIAHNVMYLIALLCAFAIYAIMMNKSAKSSDEEKEDFDYCTGIVCFKH
ncbi:uncharacterized protein LOC142348661 [Convolutriloba macropyga]|uniref:uncharacterized protein LOC142348661 n=1 Tax=Convolutriloba macropyga TaxID=536237 RepID=UPI003F51BE1C